jgi:hypothetical protein
MEAKYTYYGNCVTWDSSDLKSLGKLIDKEIEIEYSELTKNVSKEELDEVFPFYKEIPSLTLETDWSVRYFRSKLHGKVCYMVRHSAIEYVFTL